VPCREASLPCTHYSRQDAHERSGVVSCFEDINRLVPSFKPAAVDVMCACLAVAMRRSACCSVLQRVAACFEVLQCGHTTNARHRDGDVCVACLYTFPESFFLSQSACSESEHALGTVLIGPRRCAAESLSTLATHVCACCLAFFLLVPHRIESSHAERC